MSTQKSNPDLKHPYTCETCKKKFTKNSGLKRHMLTHKSNPDKKHPYKCETCQKKFTRLSGLKLHMFTHATNPDLKQTYIRAKLVRKNLLRCVV